METVASYTSWPPIRRLLQLKDEHRLKAELKQQQNLKEGEDERVKSLTARLTSTGSKNANIVKQLDEAQQSADALQSVIGFLEGEIKRIKNEKRMSRERRALLNSASASTLLSSISSIGNASVATTRTRLKYTSLHVIHVKAAPRLDAEWRLIYADSPTSESGWYIRGEDVELGKSLTSDEDLRGQVRLVRWNPGHRGASGRAVKYDDDHLQRFLSRVATVKADAALPILFPDLPPLAVHEGRPAIPCRQEGGSPLPIDSTQPWLCAVSHALNKRKPEETNRHPIIVELSSMPASSSSASSASSASASAHPAELYVMRDDQGAETIVLRTTVVGTAWSISFSLGPIPIQFPLPPTKTAHKRKSELATAENAEALSPAPSKTAKRMRSSEPASTDPDLAGDDIESGNEDSATDVDSGDDLAEQDATWHPELRTRSKRGASASSSAWPQAAEPPLDTSPPPSPTPPSLVLRPVLAPAVALASAPLNVAGVPAVPAADLAAMNTDLKTPVSPHHCRSCPARCTSWSELQQHLTMCPGVPAAMDLDDETLEPADGSPPLTETITAMTSARAAQVQPLPGRVALAASAAALQVSQVPVVRAPPSAALPVPSPTRAAAGVAALQVPRARSPGPLASLQPPSAPSRPPSSPASASSALPVPSSTWAVSGLVAASQAPSARPAPGLLPALTAPSVRQPLAVLQAPSQTPVSLAWMRWKERKARQVQSEQLTRSLLIKHRLQRQVREEDWKRKQTLDSMERAELRQAKAECKAARLVAQEALDWLEILCASAVKTASH